MNMSRVLWWKSGITAWTLPHWSCNYS